MELNKPLVSIILPVYNAENYLREAIESIYRQTYLSFELIIVDDGSIDNSANILKDFKTRFNNIYIFKNQQNMGNSFSLNLAVSKCSGKYIMRMDADDLIDHEKIFKQVEFLENNKVIDVIGCGYTRINKFGNPLFVRSVPESHEAIIKIIDFRKFFISGPTFELTDGAIMARSDWFKKWRYDPKIYYAQDFDLLCRSYSDSRFANLKDILYFYRTNSGVTSNIRAQIIASKNKWNSLNHIPKNNINISTMFFSKLSLIIRPFFYIGISLYHRIKDQNDK